MLVFNGTQTINYSRDFQYIGDNFNYRNVDTLVLNGRFQYTAEVTGGPYYGAGLSYVSGSSIWTSLPDGSFEIDWSSSTDSGLFYTDGGASLDVGAGGIIESYMSGERYTSLAVNDIWNDMDTLIGSFHDWQQIIVNGVNLGSGIVKSINFPSSNDAITRTYSVTVELPKSGDINTLAGTGYNGLSIDAEELRHVNSISESFTFSQGSDDKQTLERGLNIDLISGEGANPVSVAKSIAQGFINSTDPIFDVINYPYFYETANKTYTETYNVLQGQYSWNETVEKTVSDDPYYWSYGHSFVHQENGTINITENGTIDGLTQDRYASASDGWAIISGGIKNRINNFYSDYGGDSVLGVIGESLTRDEVRGSISYDSNYTDDPFEKDHVRFSYTNEISRDQNNIYSVSERGEIIGKGGADYSGKFATASGYFTDVVQPNIKNRIDAIFDIVDPGDCEGDLTAKMHSITYEQYESKIGYAYDYSNRSNELDNSSFRAMRTININDSVPTMGFFVTPYDGEIAQYQEQSEMVQKNVKIILYGNETGTALSDYITRAKELLTTPVASVYYISDHNYSYEPAKSTFNLDVTYRYPGSRGKYDEGGGADV